MYPVPDVSFVSADTLQLTFPIGVMAAVFLPDINTIFTSNTSSASSWRSDDVNIFYSVISINTSCTDNATIIQ